MKNKNIWLFIIVLIIGIIFRFLYLDKTGGLSYDEIVSFKQASQQNIFSVIYYTFKTDVHMPLYQIFLHIWCNLFSFSDLSLRTFSAFCGVLTIIFAFLTGRELPPPRAAVCCAALFAINSFFIYYSQEVRMYSLLTLLATLTVLLLLKIKNTPKNKWNYIWLIIISFALIHTYTIAFIYVAALFAILLYYLIKQKEKLNLLINSIIALIITFIPALTFITVNQAKYTNQINGYYCDWSSLFIVLQNLYTPVLESLANNPQHYMQIFFSTFSISKFIFIILPILCGIAGIYTAIKKDKFLTFLILAPALVFFIAEIIAFMITNFKILPRYAIISMPAFLIITAYGFSILSEYKKIKYYCIPAAFIILNLIYLLFIPNSAYKMPRVGFRPLAEFINQSDLQNSDFILVWNRKEILDKYLNKKANIISILKDFAYKSEVMLFNEQKFNSMPLDERKEILYPYFYQNQIPYNTLLLMNYIITNMQPSQKFIITTTSYFDDFDKVKFKQLVETNYKSTSLNDLLTIKSLIDIKEICDINLKFVSKKEIAPYVIRIYSK